MRGGSSLANQVGEASHRADDLKGSFKNGTTLPNVLDVPTGCYDAKTGMQGTGATPPGTPATAPVAANPRRRPAPDTPHDASQAAVSGTKKKRSPAKAKQAAGPAMPAPAVPAPKRVSPMVAATGRLLGMTAAEIDADMDGEDIEPEGTEWGGSAEGAGEHVGRTCMGVGATFSCGAGHSSEMGAGGAGTEDEERMKQRREKNRVAARKCRAKKMQTMQRMNQELSALQAQYDETQRQVNTFHRMYMQEKELKDQMSRLVQALWNNSGAAAATGHSASDVLLGLTTGTLDVRGLLPLPQHPMQSPLSAAAPSASHLAAGPAALAPHLFPLVHSPDGLGPGLSSLPLGTDTPAGTPHRLPAPTAPSPQTGVVGDNGTPSAIAPAPPQHRKGGARAPQPSTCKSRRARSTGGPCGLTGGGGPSHAALLSHVSSPFAAAATERAVTPPCTGSGGSSGTTDCDGALLPTRATSPHHAPDVRMDTSGEAATRVKDCRLPASGSCSALRLSTAQLMAMASLNNSANLDQLLSSWAGDGVSLATSNNPGLYTGGSGGIGRPASASFTAGTTGSTKAGAHTVPNLLRLTSGTITPFFAGRVGAGGLQAGAGTAGDGVGPSAGVDGITLGGTRSDVEALMGAVVAQQVGLPGGMGRAGAVRTSPAPGSKRDAPDSNGAAHMHVTTHRTAGGGLGGPEVTYTSTASVSSDGTGAGILQLPSLSLGLAGPLASGSLPPGAFSPRSVAMQPLHRVLRGGSGDAMLSAAGSAQPAGGVTGFTQPKPGFSAVGGGGVGDAGIAGWPSISDTLNRMGSVEALAELLGGTVPMGALGGMSMRLLSVPPEGDAGPDPMGSLPDSTIAAVVDASGGVPVAGPGAGV